MTWTDLAFLHWPVEEEVLRPFVPDWLELETYDGAAWLGVVPFTMSGVRIRGVPALPRLSTFPELNVRTYVRLGERGGIWFHSLDADSRWFVEAAKWRYNLPYQRSDMRSARIGDHVHYESARAGAAFSGNYRGSGDLFAAEPGSLEHFLVERYALFTENGGRRYAAEIHHPAWSLQHAEATVDLNTVSPVGLPGDAPHALFAGRQDVLVWPLRELL
jgi:hypothetical protein